jgi:small conductance mechanosensitive channel
MFSGALIGIDKAFAVGDYVSIKDFSGVVESIGFLTTKIITDEGKKVYGPNQLIFTAPFINYTASGQRKVFLDLQIANSQDLEKATKVILDEIKTFDFTDHVEQAEVMVLKQNFGIFYLEARFFMKTGENITKVRSESLIRLKKKLNESAIELATQNSFDQSN